MLAFYYSEIQSGNTDPVLLKDYAVVESLVAGVDPQLVIQTIKMESGFKTHAVNYDDGKVGCDSRGLVQIRNCNHKATDEQAKDPIYAVNFLIENIDKCATWWKNTCGKVLSSRDG